MEFFSSLCPTRIPSNSSASMAPTLAAHSSPCEISSAPCTSPPMPKATNSTFPARANQSASGGTYVSAELFSLLGARPAAGRTLLPGEDLAGQDNYVILSHALWEQRFRSDAT